jgi:bacterioferritin
MFMNNETAALLQSALLDEAHAILQYQLHAARVLPDGDVPFNDVAEHLDEHADSEKGHYKRIYDHLRRNGVEPKFGNDELIHHGDGVNEVVAAHQEAERGAIDTYTKLLELTANSGEVETNQLAQDLLSDEIEHLDDFTRYSDLSVLKSDQGEKPKEASVMFASADEALQHLSNITGKKVTVGKR